MKTLHAWWTLVAYITRYIASTFHLASPPDVTKHYDPMLYAIGFVTQWNRHICVRGQEHIPLDHPAVYCSNHVLLDDPLYVFKGIYQGSNKNVASHAMARDDYYVGTPLKTRFFDMDDLLNSVGVHGINRDKVSLSQMKTFINLLIQGQSFFMFPGRSRSRSGMIFEYRDSIVEPGGASFFLGMTQRRKKDVVVSVVPMSRNYNPARGHTTMIFGEELFMATPANRNAQREFDTLVVEGIAQLAEVCVPQVVAALLYTVCLHHWAASLPLATLQQWVKTVRAASTHPYWDEEDDADLDAGVALAVKFLNKRGIIRFRNGVITPDTDAILRVPETGEALMKTNPIQFLTNQILHLGELTESIQTVVLSSDSPKR